MNVMRARNLIRTAVAMTAVLLCGGCDFALEYHRAYQNEIDIARINANMRARGINATYYGGYPATGNSYPSSGYAIHSGDFTYYNFD
jgi:hypothetical protein